MCRIDVDATVFGRAALTCCAGFGLQERVVEGCWSGAGFRSAVSAG